MTVSNKMAYAALAQSTWTETSLGHKRRGRRLSLEQPSPGAHTGSEGAAGWAQPEGQTDPPPPAFHFHPDWKGLSRRSRQTPS